MCSPIPELAPMMQITKGVGKTTLEGSVSGVMSEWSVVVKSVCRGFAIFEIEFEDWV